MNRLRKAGLALAGILVASFWAAPVASQTCPMPGNAAALEAAVGQGVNQLRQASSLQSLAPDPRLNAAAQAHACDMAQYGYLDHRGRDQRGPHERVTQAGYRSCLTAENLAWGFPQPNQIVNGWVSSPKHRENMQLAQARHYGVGVAQGAQGPIWVMVLARPC